MPRQQERLRRLERDLPPRARVFVVGLAVAAAGVGTAVALLDDDPMSLIAVAALVAAIVVSEAFRVDLPFRRAGSARFGLGDLSLTAGLLLLTGTEVVLAAAVAAVISNAIDRLPATRMVFNVPQFVLAASLAALIMELLAPATTPVAPVTFGVAVLAITVFSVSNAVSVSTIIMLTSGAPLLEPFRRMAPMGLLITVGNAALGLWAVIVAQTHPWALPALGVPLVLMYSASRQEIRAKVDRERSEIYVDVERQLSETTDPETVAVLLAEGTQQILGCNAAVWRDDRWVGTVPEGSGPCPVESTLAVPLVARGPGLGPATTGRCAAIGLGGGILVVWEGELAIGREVEKWLDRLASSGRTHFDRATAASALEQEQATLRAVVDGTRDGICVLDAEGVVRLWNPAMARLSGTTATNALGLNAWQILGEGPWTEDGVHDVPRGHDDRVWRVSVSSVRDDQHGALRVAVVHDVTAERRVARMKDDMLAVVSHELRTPLTPIKANAQLLRRRWERMASDDREDLLERIEERADHLTRLVGDILLVGQLSASSHPQVDISKAEVDVAALLREVVASQQAAHTNYDLLLNAPEGTPATTDPVRIRQIVENLIDNACKFSEPGSLVRVELAEQQGLATVRVIDQGRGIPTDDLERVFERFERVEDPMIMTTSGAGLGLYIVRELATALGGAVEIDSTLGRGTTVTVHLPLQSGAPTRRPARAHTPGV